MRSHRGYRRIATAAQSLLIMAAIVIGAAGCANAPKPASRVKKTHAPVQTNVIAPNNTNTGNDLTYIKMISASFGWGVDNSGHILQTDDGGLTWKKILMPVSYNEIFNCVPHFINNKVAWVGIEGEKRLSIRLYKTADGGSHWRLVSNLPLPPCYRDGGFDFGFTGSRIAWLASGAAGMCFEGNCLFRTNDGGLHWSTVISTHPHDLSYLPQGSLPGWILAFSNPSTGWLAEGTNWKNNKQAIMVTKDGGRTWREQNLPLLPGYGLGNISYRGMKFFDPLKGVLLVTLHPHASGKDIFIAYTTYDGGGTWIPSTPLKFTASSGIIYGDFINVLDGWVIAGREFYKTSNGGKTWVKLTTNVNLQNDFIFNIDFINSQSGWMYGRFIPANKLIPFLLKTTDGGKTWEIIHAKFENSQA